MEETVLRLFYKKMKVKQNSRDKFYAQKDNIEKKNELKKRPESTEFCMDVPLQSQTDRKVHKSALFIP